MLIGKDNWDKSVNLNYLVEEGFISRDDYELIQLVDTAEAAVEIIRDFYPPTD